jgi:hypothetical protein
MPILFVQRPSHMCVKILPIPLIKAPIKIDEIIFLELLLL